MDSLLYQWREVYDALQGDLSYMQAKEEVSRLQSILTPLLESIKDIEDPYRSKMAKIEDIIKANSTGSVTAHGVKVSYRKGYPKVTYDSKALDGYAIANPDVLNFRSETQVKPIFSISAVD
jgi:hypothetical protein